jgi:hypothetical protein
MILNWTAARISWIYKGKSNVLPVFKRHAMKTYGVMEIKLHEFLNSILTGGERTASRSVHFNAEERISGTDWTEVRCFLI